MATEVKYLSDTWRMIRNCEISPQRAREEVRFLINLVDARIAAAKAEQPPPGGAGEVLPHGSDRTVGREDQNKAELAEAMKPAEDAKTLFATDANGTTFLAVYEVDFRRERAARLAAVKAAEADGLKQIRDRERTIEDLSTKLANAERRLALTREVWRHWVARPHYNYPRHAVLTDADIDAAIEAHQKSKADAAGGTNDE